MSANEVIVLDSDTDKEYRVNFKGRDELLKNGVVSLILLKSTLIVNNK